MKKQDKALRAANISAAALSEARLMASEWALLTQVIQDLEHQDVHFISGPAIDSLGNLGQVI